MDMASDLTDARRQRSLELWGYTPKKAAEKLLNEGYGGPVARAGEKYIVQLQSMRRQFDRDKEFWREEWRAQRAKMRAAANLDPVDLEEFIAELRSVQEQVEDVLDDRLVKGTPRVQALSELRQIVQASGKARGVDAPVERAIEPAPAQIVIGLKIGTKNVSGPMRAQLEKQGVKFDDDEG